MDVPSPGLEDICKAPCKNWALCSIPISPSLIIGSIYNKLPYANAFFDAVISVQVIHHNTAENIRRLIAEIWRVLQPAGLFFATIPMYRNQAKRFQQIEENTFLPLDEREKDIPHHIFDEEQIRKFFSAFKLLDIHVDSKNHYCFLGEKSEKIEVDKK